MTSIYKIIENNKADKGLRIANLIIDMAAFYLLFTIFTITLGIILTLINGDSSLFDDLENMHPIADRIMTSILIVIYYFIMETATKGRSIGKYITGTMVLTSNGERANAETFIARSLCRAIPFEAFSFLGKKGWHDSIANSVVVKKKTFENDIRIMKELNDIGKTDI